MKPASTKAWALGLKRAVACASGPPWKATTTGQGFSQAAGLRTNIGIAVPSRAGYDSSDCRAKRLASISGELPACQATSLRVFQSVEKLCKGPLPVSTLKVV